MALPKAVQAQLEQAEAIEREMSGAPTTAGVPADVPVAQTDPAPEPAPEPVVEEEVVAPVPEPEVRTEDFEQRYKALQGKYDAEVPRLHHQVRELTGQLHSAVTQIADLTTRINAAQTQPEAPAEPSEYVTDKDRQDFGEDLIDLQRRVAKETSKEFQNALKQLQDKNTKLEETINVLTGNQAVSAEEKFFVSLTAQVPEWEQVNTDPRFVEWLSGRFPGAPMTRKDSLAYARQNLLLPQVVELFSEFLKETAPPPVVQPSRSEALRSQVAPSRSRSAPTPSVDPSTRVYSYAEYADLMDPRKLRKMSAEEVTALMSELDAAQAEGRIR
jgi:hypothetical protein